MQATYIPKLGSWTLDLKRGFVPAENTSKYGTKRYSAFALLETGLNAQTPVVYDTIDDDGHEKRILNQQETVAAQAKLEELEDPIRYLALAGRGTRRNDWLRSITLALMCLPVLTMMART